MSDVALSALIVAGVIVMATGYLAWYAVAWLATHDADGRRR